MLWVGGFAGGISGDDDAVAHEEFARLRGGWQGHVGRYGMWTKKDYETENCTETWNLFLD